MSQEKTFYDRYWADAHIKVNPFDHHPGAWTDENFAYHWAFFGPYAQGRLLDYGCGQGQFLKRASAHCPGSCGTDVSERAVIDAHRAFPDLTFRVLADRIPFGDGEFDVVSAVDVLEHILDIESTLEDIRRVLKPGGHLLIATSEITRVKLILIALVAIHNFFYPTSPHIRYFTRHNLADVLRRKGFEVVAYQKNRTYFGFIPQGQMVVARAT
jgi:2-polyprenyl-3-methyl-5-hydroxy-6-metoxy-1,4-benzoquinol methylase